MFDPQINAHQFLPGSQDSQFQAEGPTLARQPGSPSGLFGHGQGQMQSTVSQFKPSKEVPDLDEAVVEKINAFLKAKKLQEAIDEVFKALTAKDAVKYAPSAFQGKKLHLTYSSSAHASIGKTTQD